MKKKIKAFCIIVFGSVISSQSMLYLINYGYLPEVLGWLLISMLGILLGIFTAITYDKDKNKEERDLWTLKN